MFLSIGAYGAVNETYIFAKYRFRAIFYILVCPNRTIFKKSIRGQTQGVKKVKKRSINSKLKMLPIYICIFGTEALIVKKGLYLLTNDIQLGYNFDLRVHLRSLEVKIYLFLFSPKCKFFYTLCFCQLMPMGPSMKLIYLLNRGLELYLSYRTLTSEVI